MMQKQLLKSKSVYVKTIFLPSFLLPESKFLALDRVVAKQIKIITEASLTF